MIMGNDAPKVGWFTATGSLRSVAGLGSEKGGDVKIARARSSQKQSSLT